MSRHKRQNEIIKILQENHSMSVESIAEYFNVTPTSIRRDLILLEKNKFITRSRGYAHIAESQNVSEFEIRKSVNSEEKQKIAAVAASMIKPRESVILDSGTTTLALANYLKNNVIPNISFITNSVPAAIALASKYLVVLSGGILQERNMSLIGPDADRYFQSIVADKVFIGATGVHSTLGLTSSSPFHGSIKKHMVHSSAEVIALIDSSKFSITGINVFCSFNEVKTIITCACKENEAKLNEIAKRGVNIILA